MGIEGLIDGSAFNEKPKIAVEETTQEITDNKKEVIEGEAKQTVTDIKPETPEEVKEWNEANVLEYVNTKTKKEFASFEDFLAEPKVIEKEVEKSVNPFADLMDDYDKKYFEFKKETNLGREEFDFVQQDIDGKSSLELAHDKVRKDNPNVNLSKNQINDYLEKTLNIDLSTDELDSVDSIELNSYVKSYKTELKNLQNKYKATVSPKKDNPNVEMVTLENGEKIPKEKYDQLEKQRKSYLDNLKKGVSSATSFDVDVSFDVNGAKQSAKFNYDYKDEDKHSMLSNASDVNNFIAGKFRTKDGFDYKGLASFMDKAENFDKYANLIWQQARAHTIEEQIANDNNENFGRTRPINNKKNKKATSILDLVGGNQ